MSKLNNRITQLQDAYQQLLEKRPKGVDLESYLELLRYHLNFLKEIDELVDAITLGDEQGVQKFYARRVD